MKPKIDAATLPTPIDRTLYLFKDIDSESIESLTRKVIEINEHDDYLTKLYAIYGIDYAPKPIKLYIDSYGGDVYQAVGFISLMQASATPIDTIVTGCAMSCGFLIAINGHTRYSHKNSTFMYHQLSTGAVGTLRELEESAEESQRLQALLENIVLARTKITKDKLKKNFSAKADWYITPTDAGKLGIIDKIIE